MYSRTLSNRQFNLRLIQHRVLAYLLDWSAFGLSGWLAFELRFDGAVPAHYVNPLELAVCVWVATKAVSFIAGRLNLGNWRYTSAHDAVRLFAANSAGSILAYLILSIAFARFGIPRSVYLIEWLLSGTITLGARLGVRALIAMHKARWRTEGERERTLIYGAGSAGLALLWEISQNESLMCDVIGLIDDDPSKTGLILQNKRVFGTGQSLAQVTRKHAIQKVLIAIPSATGPQMVRILKLVLDAGVAHKMIPGLGDLLQDDGLGKQLRDVAVEDLLGRKPVHLDQESIRERIRGKVVLVTGAGGSIGSEICRQIARFDPLALVGFDEAETPLFEIEREMKSGFCHLAFHAEIGSIMRADTLRHVMERYHPSVIYHAAAFKHVPMMETHVFAAVENNIFGTWQVAQAAIEWGVDDFVMISTDKAVRPTSMMGATKRVAELVIRTLQRESGTKFVAVRFGNVLGSNGSVIPIFKEQIAAGGPVTVTHPDMTRYFMTIPEAAQLVLQASSLGQGGEVFVLDMGEPVKIVDLAVNLILLSGLQPERDIEIQFTGIRPGEKMSEELNLGDEHLVTTKHRKIRSYDCATGLDLKRLHTYLNKLRRITQERNVSALVFLLKEMIPDYSPGSELMQIALQADTDDAISFQMERSSQLEDAAFPLNRASSI
jgi:FlaA1/EpsC-like NDP-sugar epimerase